MKTAVGTYTQVRGLATLPALVRKQRRLEAKIAPLEQLQADEKAVRDAIDVLLKVAGFAKGEGVTCAGYDVVHNERAGRTTLNADTLRANGVSEIDIRFATEVGKASSFATVRPMKGAKVRAA